MLATRVIFNDTHDAAIVTWDKHPSDLPLDAVNHGLWKLYDAGGRPFIYEAYDQDDVALGLILCPSIDWDADEPVISADQARAAFFKQIFDAHREAPQTGDYESREWRL